MRSGGALGLSSKHARDLTLTPSLSLSLSPSPDAYFAAKDDVPHLGLLARVLAPWRMGAPFFRECQQGVLA